MKLYFAKGACSLAVRIVIHELGLPCTFEAVNLKTKQTAGGKDFLKINPKGAVPTLELEKEILTENAVIQQYLADHHQPNTLLPSASDIKRYHVLEWLNFITTELHKGCAPLFNANIPEAIKSEIFRPQLKNKLNFVEQHLQQRTYLLGETFTLPDAYLFVILSWLGHFNIDVAQWPQLARYFNELKQRKSIQKALTEEGL